MALLPSCLAAHSLEAVEAVRYQTAASDMVDPEALAVVE
jgi:hypothetical protein